MNTSAWVIPAIIALLVAGVFFAGCSDESSTSDSAAQSSIAATPTTSAAVYSEGDIVKNPKSTVNSATLIISYNSGTDMYERATIYPLNDGSWGYRVDSKTTTISRANLEKVFTEKVSTIVVADVTIGAPTTVTTVATTATTKVTTAATTATTTTSSASAPKIKDIDPFIGTAGTTVSITDLDGTNFVSGANVSLTRSGESPINATSVSVSSGTTITCKLAIPSGTTAGSWNVVVTNPDGLSNTYANLFTIYGNSSSTSSTTTTTTTSTAATNVTLTSVSTNVITTGGSETSGVQIIVMGTNLAYPAHIKLTSGSNTITGTNYYAISTQQAQDMFTIPSGYTGTYTVSLVDSSGNVLASVSNGLLIQ
ncbi:hypothetical protein [Methanoregula sp.]|uniref:hypothetical protein n=1 Tax=Methanoregula sp. TaxID=2052170 RepID=UPI002369B165|nr:hypothetical protein [Methanoregula sp.]MDD1687047.1 hypothetical protein [Methanoregula sp.]